MVSKQPSKASKRFEIVFKRDPTSQISTIMATQRPARIPEDLAQDMILNGWDEEPIGGIDISDVEDPEYCPSGHVRTSET
ncbi:hypothetical protein MHYP_G00322430 [Metynnis hypsauchen]